MLSKYFNIEPVDTIAGEAQLFPSALMMDLKNNGLLINRRPAQLGEKHFQNRTEAWSRMA